MLFFQIQGAYQGIYLRELLSVIYSADNFYLITIDKHQSDTAAVLQKDLSKLRNVTVSCDAPVTWGGLSQVNSMLTGMSRMRSLGDNYRYYINISDSDIPLWPLARLKAFLQEAEANQKYAFLQFWRPKPPPINLIIKDEPGVTEFRHRSDVTFSVDNGISHYFHDLSKSPVVEANLRYQFICFEQPNTKTLHVRPPMLFEDTARAMFFSHNPAYLGRQWMMLHSSILQHIFAHPQFAAFYQMLGSTLIPDEAFFPTFLLNTLQTKSTIVNDNLRFSGGSPMTIDDTHIEALAGSSSAFARKIVVGAAHSLLSRTRDLCREEIKEFNIALGSRSLGRSKPKAKVNGVRAPATDRKKQQNRKISETNGARSHKQATTAPTPGRQRTVAEELIADHGFGALSNWMRHCRVMSQHAVPLLRRAQLAQIELNLPLLFLAAVHLRQLAKASNWERVLFSGRDCYLWASLYERMAEVVPEFPPGAYFHTSRVARANASPDYIEYFNSLRGVGTSVVVDLCGTGWSLSRLFEQAGGPRTEIFLVHRIDVPTLVSEYEHYAGKVSIEVPIASMLYRPADRQDNDVFEELNRAPYRLLQDVVAVKGEFLPVFVGSDYHGIAADVFAAHQESFISACGELRGAIPKAQLREMLEKPVADLFQILYGWLPDLMEDVAPLSSVKLSDESLIWSGFRSRQSQNKVMGWLEPAALQPAGNRPASRSSI
jgi:hypothetical protein